MVYRGIVLVFLTAFLFSCMDVSFKFNPKKYNKTVVATLTGDVMEASDCKVAEYIVSSFYKLAGKPSCEQPFLSFTLRVKIPFYVPVVKQPSQCKKPVCLYYSAQNKSLYLVTNRIQMEKLKELVSKYSSDMASVDKLSFSVVPVGSKVTALNVYIGKEPKIYYEGRGNRKLKFSTFMTEYLLYHGSVQLVTWK